MKLFFIFGTLLDFLITNEDQLRHATFTEVVFERSHRKERFIYKNVQIKRVTTLRKL